MKTFQIGVWMAVVAAGASSLLNAAPIPTAPIHTNKLKFRIPFHYDAAELTRLGARQIQLHVSRDHGLTWQAYQEVAPDAGKFSFDAQADGEYWFIVRTLDAKRNIHPAGRLTDPDLKVIVDTTLPRLDLELRQTAPGKVQLNWTCSDEHLDLTQLRLEYAQPGSPDWQAVPIVPKAVGQRVWEVPQGGLVSVRGSIADFAKNVAHHEVAVQVAPANQVVPRPGAPGVRQPVAGIAPREHAALSLPEHFPSTTRTREGAVPDDAQKEAVPFQSAETHLTPVTPKNSFVALTPENGPKIIGPQREPSSQTQEHPRQLAPGRQRVVNSKKFQIGYKLQDVGPSGVASVELYITQDNGVTWYRYGVDDDNQSPFQVEVPREGTYGFTLGVRSGAGLASDPPQNGDPPAIVVAVDLTGPRLEILPVEQGRGKNAGKLVILWKCTDDNLGEKPIAIFCSRTGQAPWIPISGQIENSGNFVWNADPILTPKIYLRIEARDLAGNVETVESRQPVVIDQSRPTAKIIDVESPAESVVPRD